VAAYGIWRLTSWPYSDVWLLRFLCHMAACWLWKPPMLYKSGIWLPSIRCGCVWYVTIFSLISCDGVWHLRTCVTSEDLCVMWRRMASVDLCVIGGVWHLLTFVSLAACGICWPLCHWRRVASVDLCVIGGVWHLLTFVSLAACHLATSVPCGAMWHLLTFVIWRRVKSDVLM